MRFTVDGRYIQTFTVLVDASSQEEAEEKAKQFWQHNTVADWVEIDYCHEGYED